MTSRSHERWLERNQRELERARRECAEAKAKREYLEKKWSREAKYPCPLCALPLRDKGSYMRCSKCYWTTADADAATYKDGTWTLVYHEKPYDDIQRLAGDDAADPDAQKKNT